MLDIYEERINDDLEIPELQISHPDQIEVALSKLQFDFSLQSDLKKAMAELNTKHKFLPEGVGIHTPPDLGNDEAVLIPSGCSMGAIGFY